MGSSRDIKRLSLTLTWKSESMVAKVLKSSRKFVNDVRTQAIGYFIFELEKNGNAC